MTVTARALYENLKNDRDPVLRRARDAAGVTIPFVMPEEGGVSASEVVQPYQSMGARGVNNLAAKMLLALLPVNNPFFRLFLDRETASDLTLTDQQFQQRVGNPRAEVEKQLQEIERLAIQKMESTQVRIRAAEALMQIVVTGNALLVANRPGWRTFHLDQYVIDRDPRDNVVTIVTKEMVAPAVLADRFDAEVLRRARVAVSNNEGDIEKSVEVHTGLKRIKDGGYEEWQEVEGLRVGETVVYDSWDDTPYLPLRMHHIAGESYGRGHVEQYIGDLRSLEGLMKAIVEAAAVSAKVVFLLQPGSLVSASQLESAPNASIVPGNENDVHVVQVDKINDLSVAFQAVETIKERLGFAFLLNTTIQRDAERVTAEEIRFMAQELEDQLGGVFTLMATEFQLPLARLLIQQLEEEGLIEALPPGVDTAIVTGLDALGRVQDLQRLDAFIAGAVERFGPETLQYINLSTYLRMRANALNLEIEELVKTDEQVAQERRLAQLQAVLQAGGPEVIKEAAPGIAGGLNQILNPNGDA